MQNIKNLRKKFCEFPPRTLNLKRRTIFVRIKLHFVLLCFDSDKQKHLFRNFFHLANYIYYFIISRNYFIVDFRTELEQVKFSNKFSSLHLQSNCRCWSPLSFQCRRSFYELRVPWDVLSFFIEMRGRGIAFFRSLPFLQQICWL